MLWECGAPCSQMVPVMGGPVGLFVEAEVDDPSYFSHDAK